MTIEEGIRAFWVWWETAQPRVLRAIEVDRKFSPDLIREIADRVDAIGDLDWELSPGKTSRHAFCLSPKGDPQARLITELWRDRGPSPDATWEYFAARQARPGSTLEINNVELDRNDLMVSFEVDPGRERIDATYFHPKFAKLSETTQATALYLLLDGALGEDGVERWLGHIEASAKKLEDAVAFREFTDALAELERTATGEQFVVMQGKTETGDPVFVTCNRALKRIDHILHTMHVAVDLAILDQSPHGLTTPADAEQLNILEDELASSLGGLVVYFGRETRSGHRVMHWYAPEDSAAQGIIERWSKQRADRRPQVEWIRDPTWEFVKRYV
ncbi:MAG TPA: DUF695 domain-containing protein [Kofleriaceae bacterium]|nr:DUF695 domain-containing protein [Kofleriaceae bacterium]